jgi:hypothetical protein
MVVRSNPEGQHAINSHCLLVPGGWSDPDSACGHFGQCSAADRNRNATSSRHVHCRDYIYRRRPFESSNGISGISRHHGRPRPCRGCLLVIEQDSASASSQLVVHTTALAIKRACYYRSRWHMSSRLRSKGTCSQLKRGALESRWVSLQACAATFSGVPRNPGFGFLG